MADPKCPFCSSTQVIPNVPILDTGEYAKQRLTGHVAEGAPESWWDKKPLQATFRADICCACGRASMCVEDPAALWAAWQSLGKPAP